MASRSAAHGVSGDGTTVVGYSRVVIEASSLTMHVPHAVRWTSDGGLTAPARAVAVSADGSVIVGEDRGGVLWTAAGLERLSDPLSELGADLSDWDVMPIALSDDG